MSKQNPASLAAVNPAGRDPRCLSRHRLANAYIPCTSRYGTFSTSCGGAAQFDWPNQANPHSAFITYFPIRKIRQIRRSLLPHLLFRVFGVFRGFLPFRSVVARALASLMS